MAKLLIVICIISIILIIENCDSKSTNALNDDDNSMSSSLESNEIDHKYNSIIDFKPISSGNYVLSTEMLAQNNRVRGVLNYSLGNRLQGKISNTLVCNTFTYMYTKYILH